MKTPNWARSRSRRSPRCWVIIIGAAGDPKLSTEPASGAAGIKTRIGSHSFRATGITAYLKNGGLLETAQQMAAHVSPRTTGAAMT